MPKQKLTKAQAGRLGGLATKARHGRAHFQAAGRKGAATFHQRYRLVPIGLNNFRIEHRDTGRFVNYVHPPTREHHD